MERNLHEAAGSVETVYKMVEVETHWNSIYVFLCLEDWWNSK